MSISALDLTSAHFKHIRDLMYDTSGVNLVEGKEELVKARLSKRIRVLGLDGFDEYVRYIEQDSSGDELFQMVDELTTNKTSFFRESAHFDLLREEILPAYKARGGRFRIWSAGCSSGEEPYTMAVTLNEALPDIERRDAKILATDISPTILDQARSGVYTPQVLAEVPDSQRKRYFEAQADGRFAAKSSLRSLISFALLNLMEPWPMKGPFDVIFCRNVMIYFDQPTRERLVQRYHELLTPGGILCVGHSESLNSCQHGMDYVQPAVYRNGA
jgi:chemotaxis protein methyltransferase CheR